MCVLRGEQDILPLMREIVKIVHREKVERDGTLYSVSFHLLTGSGGRKWRFQRAFFMIVLTVRQDFCTSSRKILIRQNSQVFDNFSKGSNGSD